MTEMTRGEKVIRPDFAKTPEVKETKTMYTLLYDKLEDMMRAAYKVGPMTDKEFEITRCCAEAQRHLEIAAMFAVKAMTA